MGENEDPPSLNPNTPARDGEPAAGPDPKIVKTGDATGITPPRLAAKSGRLIRKWWPRRPRNNYIARVRGPTAVGRTMEVMYQISDPTIVIREPIFVSKNWRNLNADHGWVTGNPMGPLTNAPSSAGAV